jgi:hypothetical protein
VINLINRVELISFVSLVNSFLGKISSVELRRKKSKQTEGFKARRMDTIESSYQARKHQERTEKERKGEENSKSANSAFFLNEIQMSV